MKSQSIIYACAAAACAAIWASPAFAGPPFLTDDPDTTPRGEYEILLFATGNAVADGDEGEYGLDFNFGGGENLQLTAAFPISYESFDGAGRQTGVGNAELAAKIRFLHQETSGWDVAVFPRVFLPSGSDLGDQHASLLLPIWIGRHGEDWSTFGGGGCAINRGDDSQDYCVAGWAVTQRVLPNLQVGGELFHQTADTKDGYASTTIGFGGTYDLSDHVHILGYAGTGLQNRDETGRTSWYGSLLFTF